MRCLPTLLYYAIVALCIYGADNAFAIATPASGLRTAIEGSLGSGEGGGGGPKVVSSFEALDTHLRTLDLSASATSPNIAAHIVFSDDFTWDTTRTTPYVIQLPVGGPDHSQFVIDLNGKQIYTASKTGVLAFDFHDGTTSVSHDYDFHLRNGMVTSVYPHTIADGGAVDCTTTAGGFPASCDRKIVTLDFTSAAGGRVSFADLKLGGMVDDVAFDIGWSFPYVGDACIKMDGGTLPQRINIRDSNFECNAGLAIDTGTTTGVRIQVTNVEYFLLPLATSFGGAACTTCAIVSGQAASTGGGFFRIDVDMEDSFITGDLQFPVSGKLGHFSGGVFDLDVTGKWNPTTTCNSLGQMGLNAFIDNESLGDSSPSISGSIDFVGEYCSKSWVRSAAYGSLNLTANLTGATPFLLTDDTAWNRTPIETTTYAVVDGPGAGSTFTSGVDVHFTFETPITTAPATTHDCGTGDAWGCYFTNEQDAGSVFDNDYEYVKVRFGSNGSRVEYGAGTDSITAGPLH